MKRMAMFGVVLAFAASAMAANLDQGTHEVRLGGDIDFDTSYGEELDLNVGYGQFVIDNLEVGGILQYFDNDVWTSWDLGAFAELNFPIEDLAIVPFVGAGLGFSSIDPNEGESQDAFVVSGSAGAKYFITEDLAVAAQANVFYASEDIYPEDTKVNDVDFNITFSLRYYFDTVGTASH